MPDLFTYESEARDNNLALSPEDCQLLLDALTTLIGMQDSLATHGTTIHKLRKLLGIEKASEKQTDSGDKPKASKAKKSKRTKPDADFTPIKPEVVFHPLEDIKKGDNCPECLVGKVYKVPPGNFLRITGQSPFKPTRTACDGKTAVQYLRCLFHCAIA